MIEPWIGGDVADQGKQKLRMAFRHLEREMPPSMAHLLRKLRHPDARLFRIPAGVLLILGGIFSILPVLGLWMLPLGLLLIAYDVPFLREPMAHFTIWGARQWTRFRQWLGKKGQPGG